MGETLQLFASGLYRPPLLAAPPIEELAERYRGRDIAIIGNGPTGQRDYSELGIPLWVINGGWRYHKAAELCWMMDDLEGPAWDFAGGNVSYPRAVWEPITQACPVPILTAKAYPEKYPQSVAYPLADIFARFPKGLPEFGPRVYYAETICFAVAWAISIRVLSISFGGCDYGTIRPAERACLEYWIGRAEQSGIPCKVFPGSQLMSTGPLDGKNRHVPGLYGFDEWPLPEMENAYVLGDFPDGSPSDEKDKRLGHIALTEFLKADGVYSILEIGYGTGDQARLMAQAGKKVIGLDPNGREGYNTQHNGGSVFFVRADYLSPETILGEAPFDGIWSCHVLEHVDEPQLFLRNCFRDLKDNGLLAITIPPAQSAVVGGHFTLWNAGLLLYHLVRAGFDCREARVKQYGYNLSVLVRKRAVPGDSIPAQPNYPISALRQWLPESIVWFGEGEHCSFNGDIRELNW